MPQSPDILLSLVQHKGSISKLYNLSMFDLHENKVQTCKDGGNSKSSDRSYYQQELH